TGLCCWVPFGGFYYLAVSNSQDLKKLHADLDSVFPLFKVFVLVELAALVVVPCLLIASGYGLLKMRPWAWKFTLGIAGAMLALIMLMTAFMIMQGNAATLQWVTGLQSIQAELAKKQNQPPPPMFMPALSDPATLVPSNVIYLFVECAYPIIIIWI